MTLAQADPGPIFRYRLTINPSGGVGGSNGGGAGGWTTPTPPAPPPPPTIAFATHTFPEATVGTAFSFDFKPLADVKNPDGTGVDPSALAWDIPEEDEIPGLSLSASGTGGGVLSGNPTQSGNYSFEVVGSYLTGEGRQVYVLKVGSMYLEVVSISAGINHACAVTTEGGAKCWGINGSGQLGDGTTTQRTAPVDVVGLETGVTAISAGGPHTCAIHSGVAKCWGQGTNGELGQGAFASSLTPVAVSNLGAGVKSISVSRNSFACAITASDGAKCWGYNPNGQLGDGTGTNRNAAVDVQSHTSGISMISTGNFHACLVTTAGAAKCWGANPDGQLGTDNFDPYDTPTGVYGLSSGVRSVSAGKDHSCAVLTSGGARCWGRNQMGQIGDDTYTSPYVRPVTPFGLASGVAAISASVNHTCAVTTSGGAKCWGGGNLGNGGGGSPRPVDVSGLTSGVSMISSGQSLTCAVGSGTARCWGSNGNGQLGNGTTTASSIPVLVRSK